MPSPITHKAPTGSYPLRIGEIMGRAIQMENDIENLRNEVSRLNSEVDFLKTTITELIELAKGGVDDKPKPKKKKAEVKDRVKNNTSDE